MTASPHDRPNGFLRPDSGLSARCCPHCGRRLPLSAGRPPVDKGVIRRATLLIQAGTPVAEAARLLGVSRATLYAHGLRSGIPLQP